MRLDSFARNQRDPHAMSSATARAGRVAPPGHGPTEAVTPSRLKGTYGAHYHRRYRWTPPAGPNPADLSLGGSRLT
jgi:hypothetical protein